MSQHNLALQTVQNSTEPSGSYDYCSAEELRDRCLRKLRKTLTHARKNSPLYRKTLLDLSEEDIRSLEDISKLPLTTKANLISPDIYSALSAPLTEVVEVHFSSGTSRAPVPSYFTADDLRASRVNLARTWRMAGIDSSSTVAMLASYGLFSAGLLNHSALQELGAFVVPIGLCHREQALDYLLRFKPTSTVAVASYYMALLHSAEKLGINPHDFCIGTAIAGGEFFSEEKRRYLENAFGFRMYDQYGLCEINTGIAGECEYRSGLHLIADYAYPEIVDPITLKVLPEGTIGELVLTTLEKKASTLIRYRTGDLTSLTYSTCECGRILPRISRIAGRVNSLVYYRGRKIDPLSVGEIVRESEECDPFLWQLIFAGGNDGDHATLKVKSRSHGDKVRLSAYVRMRLGLIIEVLEFTEQELEKLLAGKFPSIVDLRSEALTEQAQNSYGG